MFGSGFESNRLRRFAVAMVALMCLAMPALAEGTDIASAPAEAQVAEAQTFELGGALGENLSGAVLQARGDYQPATHELVMKSSKSLNVKTGDTVRVSFSAGSFLSFNSDNTGIATVTQADPDAGTAQVLVNGAAKLYPKVTVPIEKQSDVAPCEDLILLEGVALKQGENLIQLKTNNTNAVPGTTFSSNAPMVDCLKITASAVLIWDENHGEPALTNYKK